MTGFEKTHCDGEYGTIEVRSTANRERTVLVAVFRSICVAAEIALEQQKLCGQGRT